MSKHLAAALLALASVLNMAGASADEAIRTFTPKSLDQIKAAHAGKPFVMVVWSLDCSYCEESFAALAELQQKRGISIVTIATDRANEDRIGNQIKDKMARTGLRSEVWAFGPASDEKLRYAIDPKWRGEMPRSYWFGRDGEAAAYSGVVTAKVADKFF